MKEMLFVEWWLLLIGPGVPMTLSYLHIASYCDRFMSGHMSIRGQSRLCYLIVHVENNVKQIHEFRNMILDNFI